MSEIQKPARGSQRSTVAVMGWAGCWSLALLFFVSMTGLLVLFELPFILLTGWIKFLVRTTPNVTWNWDLAGMSIVSAGLILVLAHWFLGWIVKSVASARGASWRWPWKWTWCGLVAIAILFLVGMATGGVVHQLGWIASSPEPWYEDKRGKWRDVRNMKTLNLALQLALDDAEGNIDAARRELWKPGGKYLVRAGSYGPNPADYHLLVVTGADGKVTGTLIFPRNRERRNAVGGSYSMNDRNFEIIPAAKLLELIQTNRANLKAL